jgi:hypothetical protein
VVRYERGRFANFGNDLRFLLRCLKSIYTLKQQQLWEILEAVAVKDRTGFL